MYLLNTNVVLELRKAKSGRSDAKVIAWAGGVSASSLFVSVVTILELETGISLIERRHPSQGRVLRSWLEGHVLIGIRFQLNFRI